jgi:hypothetical protein
LAVQEPYDSSGTAEGSRAALPWRYDDAQIAAASKLSDTGLRFSWDGELLNNCWVLNTNPDDYANLRDRTTGGADLFAWTVAKDVRRGDLAIVYGHGANQTFGFVGRIAGDAERSDAIAATGRGLSSVALGASSRSPRRRPRQPWPRGPRSG